MSQFQNTRDGAVSLQCLPRWQGLVKSSAVMFIRRPCTGVSGVGGMEQSGVWALPWGGLTQ